MKTYTLLIVLLILFSSCKNEVKKEITSEKKNEILKVTEKNEIKSYDYNSLEKLLSKKDGKTYVVNFWATWCGPCIKELPAFEKLNLAYKEKGVEVLLVSLDFPDQINSKLIPFIKRKNLKSEIVLLNDPDQDTWIPKISESWSGAIPATLIYNASKRQFFERSFSYEELEIEVHKFLK